MIFVAVVEGEKCSETEMPPDSFLQLNNPANSVTLICYPRVLLPRTLLCSAAELINIQSWSHHPSTVVSTVRGWFTNTRVFWIQEAVCVSIQSNCCGLTPVVCITQDARSPIEFDIRYHRCIPKKENDTVDRAPAGSCRRFTYKPLRVGWC